MRDAFTTYLIAAPAIFYWLSARFMPLKLLQKPFKRVKRQLAGRFGAFESSKQLFWLSF